MTIAFHSNALRAASGADLSISLSPMSMDSMSNEDYEVHSPRLHKYELHWAYYLGYHWSHAMAPGDSQLTFNWVKAFADFIINFNFGKGFHISSPEASKAIIPYLMHRVWHTDNDRDSVMFEIGQYGTVLGDVFVKVAWEPPYQDGLGVVHPPRIRILPLNPAYCFPVYHPHDRERILEFKLMYKFWGRDAQGTRQVMTYCEVTTDTVIKEFINDELISERDNPIGIIPFVGARNRSAGGSPWGLSDIQDLIPLNREYNEKATEISQILNYHGSPVTVITGAKPSNLEMGPRKVWTINNPQARVTNLQLSDNQTLAMSFLEMLKVTMHEMTGVPHGALGMPQPVSNTSSVALAMNWIPMMQARSTKITNYTPLIKKINALAIRYAAVFEPEWLQYQPQVAGRTLSPDQYPVLDPNDAMTYETSVTWNSPLPHDKLLTLNEQQTMIAAGLQSKVGAMRELGEAFPDNTLDEVYEELMEDQKRQSAMQLLAAMNAQFIMQATGMTPDGQPLVLPGNAQVDADGNPMGMAPAVDPALANEIAQYAFGVTPPLRADLSEKSGQ